MTEGTTWGRLDRADRATTPDARPPPLAITVAAPQVTFGSPPVSPAASREPIKRVVETLGNGTVKETWVGMRDGSPPAPHEPARRRGPVTPWALRRTA